MNEIEYLALILIGFSAFIILCNTDRLIEWWKKKFPKKVITNFQDCSSGNPNLKYSVTVTQSNNSVTNRKICNTYDTNEPVETTGKILSELGIKKEKIRRLKPSQKIKNDYPAERENQNSPNGEAYIELDFRVVQFEQEIKEKGYLQVDENYHFGKLRSYDALNYIKKNLAKKGFKTKKIRNRLYPA